MYIGTLYHGNIQMDRLPPGNEPGIIKGYEATLDIYEKKHPEIPVNFNITGPTIEYMRDNFPDMIARLKEGMQSGRYEINGTLYPNAIPQLISYEGIRMHIKKHQELVEECFGVKTSGFFPPEFVWDPSLLPVLKEFGLDYFLFEERLYQWGKAKKYNFGILGSYGNFTMEIYPEVDAVQLPSVSWQERAHPVNVLGVGGTITGLSSQREFSRMGMIFSYLSDKRTMKDVKDAFKDVFSQVDEEGFIWVYCGDFEYMSYTNPYGYPAAGFAHAADKFSEIYDMLKSEFDVTFTTVRDYLKKVKPRGEIMMKNGSGTERDSMLRIWTEDCGSARLNYLADRVREKLYMVKILKRLSRKLGISEADRAKAEELEKKAWDALLISENGDTRGWNPTAYRRLLGYEQTYEADCYAAQAIDLLAPEE
jgi:alpha-amylase/alpha-mannosidase (GH57 family)